MRDELSNHIKSLSQTRDRLVKLRTILKNKIHNLLNGHGIVIERKGLNSQKGLENVMQYSVPELTKVELDVLVTQIKHLNEGIAKLDQQIETRGQQLKSFKKKMNGFLRIF